MALNVTREVRKMEKCSVRDLRKQYAEVFGEATNASNKDWLIKRIAWRMQSNKEGDISKRARQRALEIACDSDVRMSPPPEMPKPKPPPDRKLTESFRPSIDKRLPPPGNLITRKYKGQLHICKVRQDGFEYDGEFYKSLTAVAKAITGQHCSGYAFFNIQKADS
ncbi:MULTISPECIES: DUF2924 domain-containing protein [Pirellulaceae]|nr:MULTISPECIES: DUF2924 domain-containing protein [Pirellulaceae]MCD0462298.1 DUF2924 domain-containing protein [Roseiconus lacunae]